jgi:hypothetical protein
LATFYPNLDDHSRIIECSALCAHFLGGFTDLPVDFHQRLPSLCRVFCAQLMKDESWCQTRPQACWSSWVGQNWALRNSSSQCCAQPYQHNGHIIQWNQFAVLSLDFPNQRTLKRPLPQQFVLSDSQFSTDCKLYVSALHNHLRDLPREKHLLVIDPLEQRDSSNVLAAFRRCTAISGAHTHRS